MASEQKSSENIRWFKDIHIADIPTVGGKGASLGEMANSAFPIPPGFVVTAQAYFKFLEDGKIRYGIEKKIDAVDVENTQQLEAAAKEAREIILKTKMPEALENEIKRAYVRLGEKTIAWLTSAEEDFVAVRSSATAEDLPEASFAGQQETYLNVKGQKALVDAVKKCWASLFTARAVYYRKKQNFKTSQVGIAVVVQRMVESEISGIMFTAEPTGDTSKIVIEAGFGLGEAIVSGSVTPDTYIVDKASMKIIDKKISQQQWMIRKEGRENIRVMLSAAQGKKQKLADKEILALAGIGNQIEQHYGKPEDIEWGVEKGEIYIVQSRPITTLGLKEKVAAGKDESKALEKSGAKIIIKGFGASPGIGYGEARILESASNESAIQKGDVLVTVMTNPDWVPIMKKASAIVTDEGGITCHAAIISRELGIPCIVGTGNATKKIKDEIELTVNGFDGEVYEGKIELKLPEETADEEVLQKKEIEKLEHVVEEALGESAKLKKKGAAKKAPAKEDEIEKKGIEKVAEEEKLELVEASEDEAEEIVEEFGKKKKLSEEEFAEEKEKLVDLLRKIAVKVKVNVALPDAAEKAAQTGADGVGLLRAEHMITASGTHPAEYIRQGKYDELVKAVKEGIKKVASQFKGKPVWFRTFDARTDEYRGLKGGENEPKEANPMLGWHGIRRDLDEPEILKAQFEAIMQLHEEGLTNVGIMLPFVQSAQEVKEAKEIAKSVGLSPEIKHIEFGVMVETPAAAWSIDELIEEGIDFVSFGTNDLTQLTLGIDRDNEKIQKWFTELHPGVMRQLRYVIEKCRAAGVKTSICGQAASNPEMVKKLVRYGIDSISPNIDAVKKMKNLVLVEEKKMIIEERHRK